MRRKSKPRVTRRYPLQPLADLLHVPLESMARILHVSGSTWIEYRDQGVSELVADRLAKKVGFAAHSVWPEMIEHEIEDCSISCRECGVTFVPKRRDGVFCSVKPCGKRWWAREMERRRRATPEGAARNRERRAAYYRENAEYERARERRRYQAKRDELLAKRKAARAADPQREKAKRRAYYVANRDRIRAQQAAYKEARREAVEPQRKVA